MGYRYVEDFVAVALFIFLDERGGVGVVEVDFPV